MDYSHKIADAINNKECKFAGVDDRSKLIPGSEGPYLGYILEHIKASHKFDVQKIISEVPYAELVLTAAEANSHRLLALPFEYTAFTWTVSEPEGSSRELCPAVALCQQLDDGILVVPLLKKYGSWFVYALSVTILAGAPATAAVQIESRIVEGDWTEQTQRALLDCAQTVMQAIVCLDASGVRLTGEQPPAKLSAARTKRGRAPLNYHTVVTIDPAAMASSATHGGTHASPRFHWRRGHVRRLPDGSKTLVRACVVGNPLMGVVIHDEYTIKPPQPRSAG